VGLECGSLSLVRKNVELFEIKSIASDLENRDIWPKGTATLITPISAKFGIKIRLPAAVDQLV
jgi:hypothetical protein